MPPPKRIRELVLPSMSGDESDSEGGRDEVEDMGPKIRDPQIWAWLLKDGKHLMSMSKVGVLRVWDMPNGRVIVSVDVMGTPLCWDYMMDEEGVTMIVNVETREDGRETFRIWRYNWVDPDPKLIFKKSLGGDVRSNWIEGELAGCVGIIDDSLTIIYVVNWVTLDEAYIETEFVLPPNLSAATSPDALFIYAEGTANAAYFSYSLSTLTDVATKPMHTLSLKPTVEQYLHFSEDGVQSLNFWIPTCRTLWNGNIGVFSRSMRVVPPPENFVADYVTLSLVHLARSSERMVKERHIGANITRHIAHWFDLKRSELLAAPADWDVCAMGTFAKAAVWMERGRNKGQGDGHGGRIKICFAEFPSEAELGETPQSSLDSPPASSYEANHDISEEIGIPEQTLNTDASAEWAWWEDLSFSSISDPETGEEEHPVPAVTTTAVEQFFSVTEPNISIQQATSAEHPLLEQEGAGDTKTDPIPDHSVSDGMSMEEETLNPMSFGHFCVYELPEDWERRYGGTYTVDFDDARGVAAFATGRGKIVLLEFV